MFVALRKIRSNNLTLLYAFGVRFLGTALNATFLSDTHKEKWSQGSVVAWVRAKFGVGVASGKRRGEKPVSK